MTRWHIAVAHVAISVALTVVGFGMALAGIWTGSGKIAGTAVALLAAAFILGFFGSIALYVYEGWPNRPARARLSRRDRKALRGERSRIALDAAIARLERDAGIR